ncbi:MULTISPECIES: hypothetical protein [Chromohalobacter]|uniref:hypothetical protein n=1 Tax=Chromohalobacter TaxID=42054 RepID=UPI00105BC64E|nr:MULTISPECIES: hypothetical protein [Chromohalobacter]MCI0510960.1 hypothetical protein [Chromohalobacter sp.]MCI0562097.1 hypothetical protein [Nitrososphaera sp.]
MSDTKTGLLWLAGMIALGAGALPPTLLVDIEVNDPLLKRSQNVIGIAALFSTACLFIRLGNKYLRLKHWASHTFWGVVCMLFMAGLLISSISNFFILLPFPAWLHFTTSVVLGLAAAGLVFNEFMRNS